MESSSGKSIGEYVEFGGLEKTNEFSYTGHITADVNFMDANPTLFKRYEISKLTAKISGRVTPLIDTTGFKILFVGKGAYSRWQMAVNMDDSNTYKGKFIYLFEDAAGTF